jgi:peptidoglycan/LPS O-acetylase OafA/YrhL
LLASFAVYFCLNFFYKPYNFVSVYIVDFPAVMLPVYAGYFLLGIYASRRGWFDTEKREYVFPWAAAFAANTVLYFGTLLAAGVEPETNHPLLAFAANGMTFSGVFLMTALFKKYQNKTSSIKAWLSKNSYGAYIIHYLIVFGLVYLMLKTPLPVIVKYVIQIIACPCLSWISADVLKRYTPLRSLL